MKMLFISGLIWLIAGSLSTVGFAQASASSFAATEGPVRATVGTFTLEEGSKIALELHRSEPCPCMCDPVLVEGMAVLDRTEDTVYTEAGTPVPSEEWIGTWNLRDNQGRAVSPGSYTVVIRTSIGEFRAALKIVRKGDRPFSGRMSVQASVCGFGLDVYRLITKEDAGTTIEVGTGEKVLLALPGNPTTGYQWDLSTALAEGVLAPISGVDYLPDGSGIGAGGTFFFRYEAVKAGVATLNLVYHRPWEEGPPLDSFTATIIVR